MQVEAIRIHLVTKTVLLVIMSVMSAFALFPIFRDFYSSNTPLQRDALTPLLKYCFRTKFMCCFCSYDRSSSLLLFTMGPLVVVAMVVLGKNKVSTDTLGGG